MKSVFSLSAIVLLLLTGCAGAKGEKGDRGEPGAGLAADAGADKIAASLFCTGGLEGTNATFTYDAVLFGSGNIFASAAIGDGKDETSASSFYAPTQVGADSAPVFLVRDGVGTANGGYFKLSLNRTTLVTSIEYQDTDATNGKLSWTMPASKCVANRY